MLRAIFFNKGVLIAEEKYIPQIREYIKQHGTFSKQLLINHCTKNNIEYLYFDNEEEYSYDS